MKFAPEIKDENAVRPRYAFYSLTCFGPANPLPRISIDLSENFPLFRNQLLTRGLEGRGIDVDLVPGRNCGECSVCCVALNIDSKEFQKFPGIPCSYLRAGKGCSIHATVFPTCREYHCGWRYLAPLGEEWRPDKSGVLVDFQTEEIPPGYAGRIGVRLMIVGPIETMFERGFLELVGSLIVSGAPVVLAAPGPPKHFPAGAFLNDMVGEAVRNRDFAAMERVFRNLAAGLPTHPFNPVRHANTPPHIAPDPSPPGVK
jgi:hypothetical protein